MTTPPTPVFNLEFPEGDIFEAVDVPAWNQDSTESARNGTLHELFTEPPQMLTSVSTTASSSNNAGVNSTASTSTGKQGKNGLALNSTTSNGTQLLTLSAPLQNQQVANRMPAFPVSSTGYHQAYSIPAITTRHHLAIPATAIGHQLAIPGTSNGYYQASTSGANSKGYGLSNCGVQCVNSNGNNGVNIACGGAHTHMVRPNGGHNMNMLNGGIGYVTGIRPGWVGTKKVNFVKKQKRNRTAFTSNQMMVLEQEYGRSRYLDRNRRIELSELLSLNERTIKIWFQNRRMKEKKDRLEEVTTTDSPPGDMSDLPTFVQDGSIVPVRIENGNCFQPHPLYRESLPAQAMPFVTPDIQVPDMPERPMQPFNGVQAPKPVLAMNSPEIASNVNGEENMDFSWVRSIDIINNLS